MTLPPDQPPPPSSPPPPLPQRQAAAPPAAVAATFDPHLFPSRHRPFRQWLADHNPCFLLSTVCMLLGCYLLNAELREQPSIFKILALLAVINLYEACIIPLGLILIRRTRGTARDGWWLVLFETLFLVNATFINPDFSLSWAIPLNILLWLLACTKAAILLRGLKIGLSVRTFGFFALQLAIIYGLPIFFALTKKDGEEPPRLMYGLWWLVGMLPLLYDQLARANRRHPKWDLVQNVIRRVYLIAPWVMLLIHMGFSQWAHHVDFVLADAAPPLLGLAIASTRVPLVPNLRVLARALPIFAVLLTFLAPSTDLRFTLPFIDSAHMLTPAHFTMAATILTYGYLASTFHLVCAALAVFLIAFGYLFQQTIVAALRAAVRLVASLLPTTLFAWGVTAILLAFLLLGAGTYLSLKRTRKTEPAA